MFYADASLLKPPVFKRLTGVPPQTFAAAGSAHGFNLIAGLYNLGQSI